MTDQLIQDLTTVAVYLGLAAFFFWRTVRSLRSANLSGWWSLPAVLVASLLKLYIGIPLIVVFLIWLQSRTPTPKHTGSVNAPHALRLSSPEISKPGDSDCQPTPSTESQVPVSGPSAIKMNPKVAVGLIGLIGLTTLGTYAVSHSRQHHFEPTNLGDGSILLDTETGVECSARFGMRWADEDKKAVWAAGLAAKKAEAAHTDVFGNVQYDTPDVAQAEAEYHQLIEKADNEKVPDPNSSYFRNFPLCKDVR